LSGEVSPGHFGTRLESCVFTDICGYLQEPQPLM